MPGGSCTGLAFRVAPEARAEVIAYLDRRELIGDVYIPGWRAVHMADGTVPAYCYVANRAHPQFAGHLGAESAARIIWAASGTEGSGREYVENILAHLDDLGIRDGALRKLAAWFPRLDRAAGD
jgi:cation transport protein ChaC